jgi:signal peptidase
MDAVQRTRGARLTAVLVSALHEVRTAVLGVIVVLLLSSVLPVLFGWTATVVVSGSMTPTVYAGDVVAAAPVPAREVSKLAPGAVVLVSDPGHPGRLLLHRLVGFNPDGTLITKGDANRLPDGRAVAPDAVRGVARLRVPGIGTPYLWITESKVLPLVALGVLLVALCLWRPTRPV